MKLLKWAAFILLVIVPLASVAGYLVALRSDAYLTLATFIAGSERVRERVGDHPDMRLHFFGYSLRMSGPSGKAEFSASVRGSSRTSELYAELVKTDSWKIVRMSLDGQDVQSNTSPVRSDQ